MTEGRYLPGQAYVAFSRVRQLDQLWIINYDREKIKSSIDVDAEMKRLRQNPIPALPQPIVLKENITLSIAHLNIRSLMPKIKYLVEDPVFHSSILCISETRLSDKIPTKKLPWPDNFTVERNDKSRKEGGVLIAANPCTKPIPVPLPTSPLEIVGMKIQVPQEIIVICVYRSERSMSKNEFVHEMEQMLNPFQNLSIVVIGDFNEDIYSPQLIDNIRPPLPKAPTSHKVKDFMQSLGFIQTIKEPTHEAGSLLDHIYLRNINMDESDVQDVYFSDHSAICCIKVQK